MDKIIKKLLEAKPKLLSRHKRDSYITNKTIFDVREALKKRIDNV